jgi:hypothetical protein
VIDASISASDARPALLLLLLLHLLFLLFLHLQRATLPAVADVVEGTSAATGAAAVVR